MAANDRFDALLVFDDSGKRGQLKQAAMSLTVFRKISTCSGLAEALSKLQLVGECDVIFLSLGYGWEHILQFLQQAKQTKYGEDAAYILVLKPTNENEDTKAQAAYHGLHGCLYEPYSADNLRVIAQLAARVKKEAAERRERAAVQMLLTEMTTHLRALALLRKYNKNTAAVSRRLQNATQSLKKLGDKAVALYHEMCGDVFEQSQPVDAKYQGVSDRVRKIEERKLLRQFEDDYKDD